MDFQMNQFSGRRDAWVMALSYLGGSLFLIVPYLLLPLHTALLFSVGLTLVALFGLGVCESRLAHGKMFTGGLDVMGIGAFFGGAGYVLGTIMPILLRVIGIGITKKFPRRHKLPPLCSLVLE